MSYTPKRTQYPFAGLTDDQRKKIIGVNRPLAYALTIQDQWATFERVENYNDIIYQKFEEGLISNMYYQFTNDGEFRAYKTGQQLHVNAYPSLPVTTFASISDRPLPSVPAKEAPPYVTGVERFAINRIVPTSSEVRAAQADLEIYTYVSTFNSTHVLKYNFVNDEEKNAYERADLRVNTTTLGSS